MRFFTVLPRFVFGMLVLLVLLLLLAVLVGSGVIVFWGHS